MSVDSLMMSFLSLLSHAYTARLGLDAGRAARRLLQRMVTTGSGLASGGGDGGIGAATTRGAT
jgi:hypothetical protein